MKSRISTRPDTESPVETSLPSMALSIRGVFGGVLMGMANLVPGISGGTMLLAVGIYPEFIEAVSGVSTGRLHRRSLAILGAVGSGAGVSILLLAGVLRDLVLEQRWLMYSLFIGLTLGGVPLVMRLMRPVDKRGWSGAAVGFLFMVGLSWAQMTGAGTQSAGSGQWFLLFVAGLAGASAMILPGVSGGYLLLLLGQYVPILSAIDTVKSALVVRDLEAVLDPVLNVVVPVGLGVLLGIVIVSNLVKLLFRRFPQPTLGVLLGLLLGAVVGLWPFQEVVRPVPGETVVKGQLVTEESLRELDPADYPSRRFAPTAGHVAASLALIVGGFLVTQGISRFGGRESELSSESAAG